MSDTWQTIHQRGQQTNAVWNTYSPAFTVGELTLATHQADVAALPAAGQALADQQDEVDAARAARDAIIEEIKALAVSVPRVLDGALDKGDPLHRDVEDIRAVEGDGLDSVLLRGQRTHSLWVKVNTRNAALVPPLPALVVGGKTLANFTATMTDLPVKTQAVEDSRSVFSDTRSDLRVLAGKVDKNNKRWYAAWQGNFPAGSPERDALSQIDTGGGPTPMPTVLLIASLTAINATTVQVAYTPGGGEHASEKELQWQLQSQTAWTSAGDVEQPSQQVSDAAFEQATIRFRTRVKNATGELFSPVVEIGL